MAHENKIVFYGLSTCPYCRRAKQYMEDHHIPFELVYVDQLKGDERSEMVEKVRGYNPALSFPTIVIFGASEEPRIYVGFTEEAKAAVDAA